eukprot:comp14352_c0_seq1/m.20657 comp14352_c0_seq1/g.20657  ORF comp14352_c0_seq1/g.20657 comp14352_c0_seq1/m.20657 type:complete len:182 (-) comp14352_c0_seq1:49-594(-)
MCAMATDGDSVRYLHDAIEIASKLNGARIQAAASIMELTGTNHASSHHHHHLHTNNAALLLQNASGLQQQPPSPQSQTAGRSGVSAQDRRELRRLQNKIAQQRLRQRKRLEFEEMEKTVAKAVEKENQVSQLLTENEFLRLELRKLQERIFANELDMRDLKIRLERVEQSINVKALMNQLG